VRGAFMSAHRTRDGVSTLVNLEQILGVRPTGHGTNDILLQGGRVVRLTRPDGARSWSAVFASDVTRRDRRDHFQSNGTVPKRRGGYLGRTGKGFP
jgi:hypothetical protein